MRNFLLTYDHNHTTRYPEELADRAWDNVGLLLENFAPADPASAPPPLVLLTNDVTPTVVDEAIAKRATVIVSYRKEPPSRSLLI